MIGHCGWNLRNYTGPTGNWRICLGQTLEKPAAAVDDEDEATPTAIDEGIRDAGPNRANGQSSQIPVSVDYQLLFTQRALKDLAEIIGNIAEDDAEAAWRLAMLCLSAWIC